MNLQIEEAIDEAFRSKLENTWNVGNRTRLAFGSTEAESCAHWRFRISSFACFYKKSNKTIKIPFELQRLSFFFCDHSTIDHAYNLFHALRAWMHRR